MIFDICINNANSCSATAAHDDDNEVGNDGFNP